MTPTSSATSREKRGAFCLLLAMTRSYGPCQPWPVSTGLLFCRRVLRLGSVQHRSEFIKNWYESVRSWSLLRALLPGSYGSERILDVTRVTYLLFFFARMQGLSATGTLPSGFRAATSAPTSPNPALRRSSTRGQAHGPSIHLSHAGADQGLSGQ